MVDYRIQKDTQGSITHTEAAAFSHSTIVNLKRTADSVQQVYKNFVLLNVNNHCVRMAVMQGEYRWHQHPHSDECFLVLEGELEIDLADGSSVRLNAGEAFTIPAGTVHRTRAVQRAVNLCFEDSNAYTEVLFEDSPSPDVGGDQPHGTHVS